MKTIKRYTLALLIAVLFCQVALAEDPAFSYGPGSLTEGPRGTIVGPEGTDFFISTDFKGMNFRECLVVLNSSSRRWRNRNYGLNAIWPYDPACPDLSFKIEGNPGNVEFIVIDGVVKFVDPNDVNEVVQERNISGVLELATGLLWK